MILLIGTNHELRGSPRPQIAPRRGLDVGASVWFPALFGARQRVATAVVVRVCGDVQLWVASFCVLGGDAHKKLRFLYFFIADAPLCSAASFIFIPASVFLCRPVFYFWIAKMSGLQHEEVLGKINF